MASLQLMLHIAELFLMMMAGYLAVRCGTVQAESVPHFSGVVVNTVIPCAIFQSFQIEYSASRISGLLLAVGAALVVHLIFLALTRLFRRPFHLTAVEEVSLLCSNSGQMMFPIVAAALGTEWVFYTSAFMAVGTVVVWSLGLSKISGNTQFHLKSLFCNTNVLAIIAGAAAFLLRWSLPELLDQAVTGIGGMIGPACMISIGMTLGTTERLPVSKLKRVLLLSSLRLLVYPFVCMLLFACGWVLALHPDAPRILLITTLAAAAPSSAVLAQLAQIYDNQAVWGSILNAATTLLCIATLPFIMWLYQLMTNLSL